MSKDLLLEGGNLILKSEAGRTIAAAEKIDFSTISRKKFLKHFRSFFISLNKLHQKVFEEPIWLNTSHLYSGKLFNGSARFLFNNKVSDTSFRTFKQSVGDIDITIPKDKERTTRSILEKLPKVTSKLTQGNLKYIGEKESKDQILFLFEYASEDGDKTVQLDFEFAEYNKELPTKFERFVHSASWRDIQAGVKGSLHKILIQSVAKGVSRIKGSQIVTYKRKTPTTAKRHRNASVFSFSVPEGLRIKYEPQENGKYKFKPSYSDFDRINNISEIFYLLFKTEPDNDKLKMFSSYIGTLDLMSEILKNYQIDDIFEIFISKIFHKDYGMTIDRRMSEDQVSKERAIEIFYNKFPYLRKYKEKIDLMKQVFYNTTHFKEKGSFKKSMERYL